MPIHSVTVLDCLPKMAIRRASSRTRLILVRSVLTFQFLSLCRSSALPVHAVQNWVIWVLMANRRCSSIPRPKPLPVAGLKMIRKPQVSILPSACAKEHPYEDCIYWFGQHGRLDGAEPAQIGTSGFWV